MIRFAENLNKMITAGLGGATEAPSTEVAVGHRVRYMEASGPVASFETNIDAPIRSLRVDMLPIQDLHGYDAPYPGGGGANNLCPVTDGYDFTKWLEYNATTEKYTIKQGTGATPSSIPVKNTIPAGTAITISVFVEAGHYTASSSSAPIISIGGYHKVGSVISWQGQIDLQNNDDLAGKTYTTTVTTTEELNCFEIFIYGAPTITKNIVFRAQIELGTNNSPSWHPYSNICPISGRESVTVRREVAYDPSADHALTVQLGQTVYGGTVDVVSGKLTVEWENIASYDGEALPGEWISDRDAYAPGTTPTTGAQVCYKLATPLTIQLTPAQLSTLVGENNVWCDAGDVTLEYPYYEETEGY